MPSLRYYAPVLLQITGIAGILAGGWWTWIGVCQLPLLAFVDALLDDDLRERPEASESAMDMPVALAALLGFVVAGVVAWKAGRGATPIEWLGMLASGGWLTVVVMVPTTHELYHKRKPWKYALGMVGQFLYLDYLRSAPHLIGHHIHVGTPRDHDTAPRGENMYAFASVSHAQASRKFPAVAFEITNHCDHHLDAYVPYHRLNPDASGPRMPGAFLCFLAAIMPPLWNRWILMPRLRDWDFRHASPAERALAREANRRAGWPDWLGEVEDGAVSAGSRA